MAKIEFYVGDSAKYIAVLDDGAVPRQNEFINIEGVTYAVSSVTWAVDQGSDRVHGMLRANVVLRKP